MATPPRRPMVWAALALALGYILLSTALMSHAPDHPLTLMLLFGPVVGGTVIHAARERSVLNAALALGSVAAMGLLLLPAVTAAIDVRHAYVAQHAVIHLMLAWGFSSTLKPGRTPLISALARPLHTQWTPELAHYTAALTALWARYFVAMVVVSLLIYALLPWSWWTVFCTVITPATAVALFVGEPLWRYRVHPEFERVSLEQAWRAYKNR